jgi:hypothetical protein
MFSTSGPFWEAAAGELPAKSRFLTMNPFGMTTLKGRSMTRNSMAFRSEHNATFGARILRQPGTEDKKLRKDPFGGPCFEGTLRKPRCFSE